LKRASHRIVRYIHDWRRVQFRPSQRGIHRSVSRPFSIFSTAPARGQPHPYILPSTSSTSRSPVASPSRCSLSPAATSAPVLAGTRTWGCDARGRSPRSPRISRRREGARRARDAGRSRAQRSLSAFCEYGTVVVDELWRSRRRPVMHIAPRVSGTLHRRRRRDRRALRCCPPARCPALPKCARCRSSTSYSIAVTRCGYAVVRSGYLTTASILIPRITPHCARQGRVAHIQAGGGTSRRQPPTILGVRRQVVSASIMADRARCRQRRIGLMPSSCSTTTTRHLQPRPDTWASSARDVRRPQLRRRKPSTSCSSKTSDAASSRRARAARTLQDRARLGPADAARRLRRSACVRGHQRSLGIGGRVVRKSPRPGKLTLSSTTGRTIFTCCARRAQSDPLPLAVSLSSPPSASSIPRARLRRRDVQFSIASCLRVRSVSPDSVLTSEGRELLAELPR